MSVNNPAFVNRVVPCHGGNQTATSNGKSIDTLGCQSLLGVYQFGTTTTGTSGTVVINLDESSDDSSFTAITGATTASLVPDTGGMNAKRYGIALNLVGRKRYIRMTVTIGGTVATGATGPLNNAGTLIASNLDVSLPTTHFDALIGPISY